MLFFYVFANLHEKKGLAWAKPFETYCLLFISAFDLHGFIPFWGLVNLELYSITFSKDPIAVANNVLIMHEHITGSVFFFYKTIAFFTIEPLDLTETSQMSSFQALPPLALIRVNYAVKALAIIYKLDILSRTKFAVSFNN